MIKYRYKVLFILVVFIWNLVPLFAQTGKDGARIVTTPGTVVNRYARPSAGINPGFTSITVTDIADLSPLSAGDLILTYQTHDLETSIDVSNTANYGRVLGYNHAGNYEFAVVKSITGNTIDLVNPIKKDFTGTNSNLKAQIIRVPQYSSLTINAGASITAPAWNGQLGGVVAVHVSGNMVVNGIIDVNAKGFRGGQVDNNSFLGGGSLNEHYVSNENNYGGEKGESIIGWSAEYDALGGRYGRGAPANGGGGGNNHNSGGGGGANVSNGNAWTGQGVMLSTVTGGSAWQLDPGYISNRDALTNSSGGGRGGYSWNSADLDALTKGPGIGGWEGDKRSEVGGLGGHSLTADPETRVFFGGGGGAGDMNNMSSQRAGNGGGLVLIMANSISGSGAIRANGEDGLSGTGTFADGAGGGGAGGSIIIKAPTITGVNVSAKGGKGADIPSSVNAGSGPGGGGSGGLIAIPSGTFPATINVSGGISGQTTAPYVSEFPVNGATNGAPGKYTTTVTYKPVAVNDSYTMSSFGTYNGASVLANDSDPNGDALIVNTTPVVGPQYGTLTLRADGTFTYSPNANFSSGDSFTYSVCDNGAPSECVQATVTISIPNPYFNPTGNTVRLASDCFRLTTAATFQAGAVWRRIPIDLNHSFNLTFKAKFSDLPTAIGADGLTFSLQNQGINALGTGGGSKGMGGITPALAVEFDTYQNSGEPVEDHTAIHLNSNFTSPATGNVPVQASASQTNIKDGAFHDIRINWNAVTHTLSVYFDGSLRTTYVNNIVNTVFGNNPMVYWGFSAACSGGGNVNEHTVCNILMNNDIPLAVDDPHYTINEDQTLNAATVLANDTDPNGNSLTASIVTPPSSGSLIFNADGTFTYTPAANANGAFSFTYKVCDNGSPSLCSPAATVTVMVNPVNDAPVFVKGFDQTINEDAGPQTVPATAPGLSDGDPELSQTITFTVTNDNNALFAVQPTWMLQVRLPIRRSLMLMAWPR